MQNAALIIEGRFKFIECNNNQEWTFHITEKKNRIWMGELEYKLQCSMHMQQWTGSIRYVRLLPTPAHLLPYWDIQIYLGVSKLYDVGINRNV